MIITEGELQASEKLMQAAKMLGYQAGRQAPLRYMQTLESIAGDESSIIGITHADQVAQEDGEVVAE